MTRILALDVGERRIGVALSDPLGYTAQPLAVLTRRGGAEDVEAVAALVEAHHVSRVVVGLPLTLRGAVGASAQRVRSFAGRVGQRIAVPVEFVDERFTTAESERVLLAADASRRRRKQVIDQMAAQLILQQYLERNRLAA